MKSTPTILMYSPDTIGLGHVRRNSTIATELVRQDPSLSVVLTVGSGAGAFFSLPKGIDSVKLPSIQKVAAETWRPRSLNLSPEATRKLRSGMLVEVVRSLKPDILVVDHLPLGVWGELQPSLEVIAAEALPTKVVLGLRDILDEPSVIRERWTDQGVYDAINTYYDGVLVYGDQRTFATADAYGLTENCDVDITYCGYVCDAKAASKEPGALIDALIDRSCGGERQRLLIACGGGGHDAYPMLSATLSALAELDDDASLRSIVIAGPLMPEPDRNRLNEQARNLKRTTLMPWASDCSDYIAKADVSVIMGGYNLSLEALTGTSQIVMIPRSGPSAEQSIRADKLAQRGLVRNLPLEEAKATRLAGEIKSALAAPPRVGCSAKLSGSVEAAQALISMLGTPNRTAARIGLRSEVSAYVVF